LFNYVNYDRPLNAIHQPYQRPPQPIDEQQALKQV
jgi:hypothetical protein